MSERYRETAGPPPAPRDCEFCGGFIERPDKHKQRFCSHECKNRARSLEATVRRLSSKGPRSCPGCGGVIGPERRSDAKACSETCAQRLRARRKGPATRRAQRLRYTHGIDAATYESMRRDQGGRCLICGTDDPGTPHGFWAVDHCHESGAVRGLLCNSCNLGIGLFADDVERLREAIAYLSRGAVPSHLP